MAKRNKTTDAAAAAAEALTRRQKKFPKPADAAAPTGEVVVVMATGGTFLGSHADVTKSPKYYKDFWTFIEKCNLEQGAVDRGFYADEEGRIFDREGRQVIYMPSDPSIDSTDATSEKTRVGFIDLIETSKQTHSTEVDTEIVQGTDTGANTAGTLDLVYGRDTEGGMGVVTSQKTSDSPRSDGPDNFWICYDGIQLFRQVIVPTNSGRILLPGNIRKKADNSVGIYIAAEGAEVAVVDMDIQPNPNLATMVSAQEVRKSSFLAVVPVAADYDSIAINHYEPTAPGNQTRQAMLKAREIRRSLKEPDSYTGVVIKMAGSNNIPGYAKDVLLAADNVLPIFACSDVPGAKTESVDGAPKYTAAGVILAERLGLNNLIELPATRIGPDMRTEIYMAYAAKYSTPRTPEFLLLCHLMAAFAWTPEDNNYSAAITGDRQDLVRMISALEIAKGKVIAANPIPKGREPEHYKEMLSRLILADSSVRSLLHRHIPNLVDQKGRYELDEQAKLKVLRRPHTTEKPAEPAAKKPDAKTGNRKKLAA